MMNETPDSKAIRGEFPIPAAASAGLKAVLEQSIQADLAAEISAIPQSPSQWQTLISNANSVELQSLEHFADESSVTIAQDSIANVRVYQLQPAQMDNQRPDCLFVHLHGGAYILGAGKAALREAIVIADRVGIPVLSIDYRMPPEHPFPNALEDVTAVYKSLLGTRSAGSIAIGGSSAGAGLALSCIQHFAGLELDLPAALFAGTPWADLTKTSDSLFTNEGIDRVLAGYDGILGAAALLYADGKPLTDAGLSPIYGDFSGFPPSLLVTGTRDLFLSDTARTHRKLRDAGVEADLHVYEGLSHADYAFETKLEESHSVYLELKQFLRKHLAPTA